MNVGQVIELTREWVELYGSQMPGFVGAHLMGSLNTMPKEAPFPVYKDVDLHLVLENAPEREPDEINYHGLILECGLANADLYRPAEKVLADPTLASNLAVPSILADPTGLLSELHTKVVQEYSRRRCVMARCTAEKTTALQGLAAMQEKATSPVEALWASLGSLTVGLTGMVAVANLQPPTHRRCLIVMKEILSPLGKANLQENLLALLGYAALSRGQVENYLQVVAETFDRAVQVVQSPVPFRFKLHPHVRPYAIEATQEMIEAGYHREAMGWILFFMLVANQAIQIDAPADERPYFQAKAERILADVGWDSPSIIARRLEQAKILVDEIFSVTDEMVRQNLEITE
jgi:hypothetical protein